MLAVICAGLASAIPVCVSGGTLASYEALAGGCIYDGSLLFSNFIYGNTFAGAGAAVSNTNVFLTLVGAGTYNRGIVFSTGEAGNGWSVQVNSPGGLSFVDSSIQFTVTALSGGKIEDGTLTLLSFGTGGSGRATIGETINPGGVPPGFQYTVRGVGPTTTHEIFPASTMVTVLKDIQVRVPASGTGFATINSFEEDFSQMPEPVGSVLIGSGLLALGIWRRRMSRG
jgi:hypothetical protein